MFVSSQAVERMRCVGLVIVIIPVLFLLLLQLTSFTQVSKAEDQPDLLLTGNDISFSRLDVVAGEQFTAYARIRNIGSGAGNAVARLYVCLEGQPLGPDCTLKGEENVTVPPGGSSVAAFPMSIPAGLHEVMADITEVNPNDADQSNNNASTAVEIFSSPESVDFSSPTLILEPTTITIQDGTERTVPLDITALGGDSSGVTIVALDSAGVFVEPAHSPINLGQGETGKIYIRISVPKLNGENGSVERGLLIQAIGDNAMGNSVKVTLHIHPPVTSTSWWNPTTTTATILGLFAAVLAAINSIEWGRYKFLGIFLPLYTKLKKEDVMNQYTRGKIHGYLLANPGDYFSSIGKALDISGGNLAYHLRVLEREGKIVSRMDGIYKRFYPRGARIECPTENELSSVQRSIYDAIEETPGIIQREIASVLGVTSATVSYHLKKLVSRGLVKARRKGMAMRYFVSIKRIESIH